MSFCYWLSRIGITNVCRPFIVRLSGGGTQVLRGGQRALCWSGHPRSLWSCSITESNFLKTTCSCWLDSLSAPASCSFCSWPLSISFDSVLIVSLQNPFFIFATSNWENSVSCSLWPPRVCSPFTYPNKTSLPCWARRSKPRTCSKRSSLEAA